MFPPAHSTFSWTGFTHKLPVQGKYLTLAEAVVHWPHLYSDKTRNKTEGLIDSVYFLMATTFQNFGEKLWMCCFHI